MSFLVLISDYYFPKRNVLVKPACLSIDKSVFIFKSLLCMGTVILFEGSMLLFKTMWLPFWW